jgi:hypothetical protein
MWRIAIAIAALVVAEAERASAAERPRPVAVERDWGAPPPGAPEDQRLWRELKEGTAAATVHLARIAQCAFRIRYGRYYEALDARPGDAQAMAARAGLAEAATSAQGAIPPRPGVYGCRRTLLDLDQRIELPKDFKDVDQVRRDARDCVARMRALVSAVEPAADRLESALSRIDLLLGRARPALPEGVKAPAPDDSAAAFQGGAR